MERFEFEVDFETDGTTSAFNFDKPDEDCEKVFPVIAVQKKF